MKGVKETLLKKRSKSPSPARGSRKASPSPARSKAGKQEGSESSAGVTPVVRAEASPISGKGEETKADKATEEEPEIDDGDEPEDLVLDCSSVHDFLKLKKKYDVSAQGEPELVTGAAAVTKKGLRTGAAVTGTHPKKPPPRSYRSQDVVDYCRYLTR